MKLHSVASDEEDRVRRTSAAFRRQLPHPRTMTTRSRSCRPKRSEELTRHGHGVSILLSFSRAATWAPNQPICTWCCPGRDLRSDPTSTWRRSDTLHRSLAPSPAEHSTVSVYTPDWPVGPAGTHSNCKSDVKTGRNQIGDKCITKSKHLYLNAMLK